MNKKKIITLTALIIIFIILTILVINGKTTSFDKTITNFIINTIPENINEIIKIITTLGGSKLLPPIVLITFFTLIYLKKSKYAILIILNSLLATASYLTLKSIIQRPRPDVFRFINETGYSFPSGHATTNMAFYGIIIYLIWKKVKNKKLKIFLTIILSIWILIMGISRIYFNVHYPTDIIAGFILGIICILLTTNLSKKLEV